MKPLTLTVLLMALTMLTAIDLLARFDTPPPLPLIHADYERCLRISPGPFRPSRRPPMNPRISELS